MISYIDLKSQWIEEKEELEKIIEKIMSSGEFVDGEDVKIFEKNILKYTGTKYAVALNSGTDALTFALSLCNIRRGDEVITPPNSFIASTGSIAHLGAVPIFVDVDSDRNIDVNKIESAITSKTKAIMAVHLSGRVCNMEKLSEIAKEYNLKIIEDAAQAIGSKYNSKFAGSFGDVGCFSAHPLKNLNACGDSGYISTNNEEIYNKAIALRNHGLINRDHVTEFGYVSRMDTLQAAILNFRLTKLDKLIEKEEITQNFTLRIYLTKKLNFRLKKKKNLALIILL